MRGEHHKPENALFACMTFEAPSHVTCLECQTALVGPWTTNTRSGGQVPTNARHVRTRLVDGACLSLARGDLFCAIVCWTAFTLEVLPKDGLGVPCQIGAMLS